MKKKLKIDGRDKQYVIIDVSPNDKLVKISGFYKLSITENILIDYVEVAIDSDYESIMDSVYNLVTGMESKVDKYKDLVQYINTWGDSIEINIDFNDLTES
jgi:hypothetical protein